MENVLLENREHGWADASTAPMKIQARIIEIRKALLAGRKPKPSSFDGVEQRSSAFSQSIERKLFPVLPSLYIRKRSVCLEARVEQAHRDQIVIFRARAQKQAAVIAASAPKKLSEAEQYEIRCERRRCFPWEN